MTATLLLQIAAKATLVLLGGLALTRAMSRTSAAARHLVWVLTLGAAFAVPLMHAAGPAWTLAILPEAAAASAPSLNADAVDALAIEPLALSDQRPVDTYEASAFAGDWQAADEQVPAIHQPVAPSSLPASLTWGDIVVRFWLVGVALLLARLCAGMLWATMTVRRACELPDTGWQDSLDEAAAALGLARQVGLRVSAHAAVPMATGVWRAVVLLPPDALEWDEERRRVVLQHELSHVKRRDCLLQALAQVVSAVYWFNPLAHMAVARLRAEQERACDDMVIQVGTDARSYADHLFEIARSFRAASFPTWVAMSMARPSQLEGRMLAILDTARVRRAPAPALRVALVALTLAVALPVGALHLAPQTSQPVDGNIATVAVAEDGVIADPHEDSAVAEPVNDQSAVVSVDVVHGNLTAVDTLALSPSSDIADAVGGDAMQAAQFKPHIETSAEKSFLEALKDMKRHTIDVVGSKGIAGEAAAFAAQGTPAVSDETRRRVADALISALNDDNPQVRQEALTALASMRDERAIPGLIRALNDPTTEVRMRAMSALVQFNTPAAADGVLTALKDRSPQVRQMAARYLSSMVSRGQLRDAKYVDAFSALLKDDNADVREQAADALGDLRMPSAAAPLTQALRDSSADVRKQAARSLANLGNVDAVPSILPLLKDPVKDVREQAAVALGALADARAIDALTAALKDSEASVREQAARALGQIARGQRRGVRPGVPVPPLPPLPPRVSIDPDLIRDIEDRARDAAERAGEAMRNFDRRFGRFDVMPFPEPAPAPAPAAPAAPAPPAPPAPPR